ncbi:MAG: glycoside hydrolase family 95 protein [Reichenbachiella sp.]
MTKIQPLLIITFTFLVGCDTSQQEKNKSQSLSLWYNKPAQEWEEALPIGNGRLGAMVYGGIAEETIQFNEETLWTGQPHDYAHPGAHEVLDELRQLLWEGKQQEAHKLGNERFMSQPFGQFSYQPFGKVWLKFPGHDNATNFKRELNLENALTTVRYEVDGVDYKREVFASHPDQAIIARFEASKNGQLSFNVGFNTQHSNYDISVEDNVIILKGKANNYHLELDYEGHPYPESKILFEARIKVLNEGGKLKVEGNSISVENANNASLFLVAATNFVNYDDISGDPAELCREYLDKLEGKPIKQLRESHIVDYQNLFNRVSLDLGKSKISSRPTNQRLNSFYEDEDPSLVSLLYQFGRYLLISSSRSGTQPANLQGIWNDKLVPPWDSKYTININTEMNYWPAEMTNLSELADPVIQLVEDLSVTGQNVAKQHYNLDGWVTHHNTDIWRGAAPINHSDHGIWVTGGAWLCQNLWWRYQFSGDKDYLKNKAYPILKSASQFFSGYLIPDPQKPEWLVSGPSNSPENGGLAMAPTMDHQIIRNLFANTIEAANILGVDAKFADDLKKIKAKIAPNLIGKHGQLQEWLVDKDSPEDKHRHVSHLWGLHPGNEIHPFSTPDLAQACKVTLSHRGDAGTGWSRAWKINFWARLLDGDHSFLLLKNLMVPATSKIQNEENKGGLFPNLMDAHPPFQIDGNFGATSGITEMLLQSHLRDENGDYYQDLLPAPPTALPEGEITGLRARGAFEIDIEWSKGMLTSAKIKSLKGNNLNVRYHGKTILKETKKGDILTFHFSDFE